MAINFDQLPDSVPGGNVGRIIPKGTYFGTIEKAEMKKGQDPTKPEYLNVTFRIHSAKGDDLGLLWDKITESSNDYARYKLKRFVTALGLNMMGTSFELKDLAKVAPQVKMIIDVNQDKENKNQIDIFSGDVYYHISEASKIFGEENLFVDASDAEDAAVFGDTTPTDDNVEY